MAKKSYMDRDNILSEGFLSKIANFFKSKPKLDKKQKQKAGNKLKAQVNKLNSAVDRFEASLKKQLGDDYPDMPRFETSDFLEG